MTKSIPHRNRTLGNSLAASLAGLLLTLPLKLPAGEISTHTSDLPRNPLTLQECIAIALGESPKLEASRFDLLAATAEIRAAQSMALPSLTGSGSAEWFSGSRVSIFSVLNATSSNVALVGLGQVGIFTAKLDYPVFKDGSIFGLNTPPAVAVKKAEKEALAWTTHLTREEVIYRITDTFITTVSAQNREDFVDLRINLLEKSAGIIREQQKQGLSLPIDLQVAEEELSGARTLSKVIHDQVVAGKKELAMALGLLATSPVRLSSTLPKPPEPPSADVLLNGPLRNHPSLQVQLATIDKALQEYRLERFRMLPSVSLDGRAIYGNRLDDFDLPGEHIYTGAVIVSVPIFDFGAQNATVRAKRMTYLAQQARLAAVTDDVTYEIVKAYQQIYSLSQNILTIQQEVAKADREARLTASQQGQGITTPLTANEAQLTLLGKQDDLQSLQARRLLLYAALQKATGGAWKWIP